MFSGRIQNCYDSHVHWLGTGDFADRLSLEGLNSPQELAQLKIDPGHFRGGWLLGRGWNQNSWPGKQFPTRHGLDKVFGNNTAVAFSRVDGHALWVSTEALKRANLFNTSTSDPKGGKILRDADGYPSGVLIDKACDLLDEYIPKPTAADVRRNLLKGMQIFNRAGFTHIRDMSCSKEQWQEAVKLEGSGLLTLAIEQYFSVDEGKTFEEALNLALDARKQATEKLRVQGIKVYVDGALGSEGAWIGKPYCSGHGNGLQLLSMAELEEIMRRVWGHGLDLAVHTIGDEAAHQVVSTMARVYESGTHGRLHLEHAELLRPDTIRLMVGKDVFCHMQPCHWLSDHHWLKEKIGELENFAFPWRALQEAQLPFDFGSDSPIERPSLVDNIKALQESAIKGVPALLGDPVRLHSHEDSAWVTNCYSVFADGIPVEVVFDGEHLI